MIKNISVIGAGNLAECFIERIIASKKNHKVFVYDIDGKKDRYSSNKNIEFSTSIDQNLSKSHIILIAIKPHDFKFISKDIVEYGNNGCMVVSLMAGIKLNLISKALNKSFYTARVMSNINARFGNAQTFIFVNKDFPKMRLNNLVNFMKLFGSTSIVNKEIQMDKLTALCGSGPAYFIHFTEIVKDTFKKLGFKENESEQLAKQLLYSTGYTCYHSNSYMKDIKKTIVSKKGTTDAALSMMDKRNIRKLIMESIDQAYKKSIQLGKEK